MLNNVGTKTLETDRTVLRPFRKDDARDMYNNWASDDEVTKYLTWPAHKELKVTQSLISVWVSKYINMDYYQWAIYHKEAKQVIGSVSLMNIDNYNENGEIGYCMGRRWWNKGIMTEVFKEILRFGFNEVGFARITARHDILNTASGCVMEKCGLSYEGTMRKILKNGKGNLVDCRCYSILKEEYGQIHEGY